jgi:hypothetical protein
VFALHGTLPNPSGPDLRIAFTLPEAAPATLELLDLAGRRLESQEVGSLGPGRHVVQLGRRGSVPSGLYVVRLTRAGRSLTMKAVVID